MEKIRSRQVAVLFLVLLTDMIGFGMSLPLFGILFGDKESVFYFGNQLPLENLAIFFGIFIGVYGLGQFIANPILGSLSDTVGRRPVLIFAIFGTFISRLMFLFGLLRMNIPLMFISRFVDGGTGGIISLSNASLTDTTNPQERSKYIGQTMAGFSLGGFVLGPVLFILFSYTGNYWSVVLPFAIATAFSGVAMLTCFCLFPETLAKDKIHRIPNVGTLFQSFKHSLVNLKKISMQKNITPFFLASGLFYLGFSFYTTFASQYMFSHYNLGNFDTGIYFLIVGVIMTIMQGFLAYRIINYFGSRKLVLPLGVIFATSMILFALAFTREVLFVNAAFFAVLTALTMVLIQSEVAKIPTENKGALMGAFSSVQVLMMAVAPVVAGLLTVVSVQTPFLVGAFCVFSSCAVLFWLLKK